MSLEGIRVTNIFFAGALIFTVLVLIILLFVYTYQSRLMRQKMSMQDMETEQQKKLLEASVLVQEKERQRIARDLHDDVGATLSLIKLQFGQFLDKVPEFSRNEFRQTSANLSEAIKMVRRISHDLLPPTLDHLGLTAALQRFFLQVEEANGPKVDLKVVGRTYRLDTSIEMHVYRIVHELTQNCLKHANADQIHCVLTFEQRGLSILFKDNGKGLDEKSLQQLNLEAGLGWKNIQSRLQVIDGNISILEEISDGLALKIFIPKKPKPQKDVS